VLVALVSAGTTPRSPSPSPASAAASGNTCRPAWRTGSRLQR